jgi:hypothetical protein
MERRVRREQRQRLQTALFLLVVSGVIRSANLDPVAPYQSLAEPATQQAKDAASEADT